MIKLHFCVIFKNWNVEVIDVRIWSLFHSANCSVFVFLHIFNNKKTEESDGKEAGRLVMI